MLEALLPLTPWHWLIMSIALIVIEMIFFGAYFFLSCGIAAGVLAMIVFFLPNLSWEMQGVLFAILSVAIIIVWKRFFESSKALESSGINEGTQRLIGQIGVMEENGRVRIGDSTWPVQNQDLVPGDRVRVTAAKDIHLTVEKIS